MTASLILYDDSRAQAFEPLTLMRPACELVAGIATIRERWEDVLGMRADGFISRKHLVEFEEERAPSFYSGDVPADCIVVNSRFVPALRDERSSTTYGADADVWSSGGRVAAIRIRDPLHSSELATGNVRLDKLIANGHRNVDIPGVWLENLWDLIRYLPAQLSSDINCVHATMGATHSTLRCAPSEILAPVRLRESLSIVGDSPVLVASDAVIDPHVVMDARNGPILIASGTTVHSFTRIEGPCFVGPGSTVMAGRIALCAIGEKSKVCGEMSNTIILGFTNKAHDGFIGHSILGRWVNIGAGTITSNLKNTYGPVGIWTPSGTRETGMQFLGSFFGDHARTGIGTMLATGSVISAGANVFGGEMPPRYVPPFAWGKGEALEEYRFDKFLEVAERVLSRRKVPLTDGLKRHYEEAYRLRGVVR